MARHRKSSLYGGGITGFDEFTQKKSHITLRSCLLALCFDLTTLFEIAVYREARKLHIFNFLFPAPSCPLFCLLGNQAFNFFP